MKVKQPRAVPLVSRVFGLDLRSLAAFRIGVAVFILFDLVNRSFDLTAHYTDAGVMPRAFAVRYFSSGPVYQPFNPAIFCVHLIAGTGAGIAAIFLLHALATIGLLLGYRTRLMTFVVWFLLAGLQMRNPLVNSVGDSVLLVLLFFAIFLPLGARYSIDSAWNTQKNDPQASELYASPSSAVFYLQFICIYFFSALLKSAPEWRSEGTALYYAFNIDQFALPLGKALLGFPELLKVLTFVVWWIELLGGFVLLIPSPLAKLAGVLLFAGLQAGIGATLSLGHNPWVNCVVLLPFLPGFVWNWKPIHSAGTALKTYWWREALAVFFFVCVLIYNANEIVPMPGLASYFEPPTLMARLEQHWGMFAPLPNPDEWWIVVEGQLRDGAKVDAFRRENEVRYEKPKSAGDFYPNERWRRYMMNIATTDFAGFRAPFGAYVCSSWNDRHTGPEHLDQLNVTFMSERTPPPGQSAQIERHGPLNYPCTQ